MKKADLAAAFDLTGQTALITGGGSKLAFGLGECFVAAGAHAVLLGRREQEIVKACANLGEDAFPLIGDITKQKSVTTLVDRAEQLAGPVTILINNINVHLRQSAVETADTELAAIFQSNFLSTFTLTREVGRRMIERRAGAILFISSMTPFLGMSHVSAYAAAKSACLGLMRGLATEWGPYGIRINAIMPGWMETDASPSGERSKALNRTPLNRFAQSEDIGLSALFLCSPAAKFVTGAVLPVDGGATKSF